PRLSLRFLKNLARNLRATGPAFFLGISLAALFQRYVPAEAVAALFGKNRGFGLLMAATVGVPLYVCGGGTIPLLIAWMENGMSLGSASAFMITGPAMKITNLGAVKIILGLKNFAIYIAFSVIFALLTGFLIDLLA
ncbi:MAG: permease, partial [Treponema sp.]|nr:permease [Treponema sp.]